MIEGYLVNGNFSYRINRGYPDVSYTSLSHGWSTGPTSGLTNYVLGLDVVEPGGAVWSLAPQIGELEFVEGGFATGVGKFRAKWVREGAVVRGSWSTPVGTVGMLTLPWKRGQGWEGWAGSFAGWEGSLRGGRGGGWGGWHGWGKRWFNPARGGQVVNWAGAAPLECNITTSQSVFGEELITIGVAGGEGSIVFPA